MTSIRIPHPAEATIIPHPAPAIGFVSLPTPGNTWTWAQRLGTLLHKAEADFGGRILDWTLLGVEFGGAVPMIWYPGDRGDVIVRLSEAASLSPAAAFSELAHETIHLLAPNGGGMATNLEEGLATFFSERECAALGAPRAMHMECYAKSAEAVRALVRERPDGIRALRSGKPRFDDWTARELTDAFPSLAPERARWLLERFERA